MHNCRNKSQTDFEGFRRRDSALGIRRRPTATDRWADAGLLGLPPPMAIKATTEMAA